MAQNRFYSSVAAKTSLNGTINASVTTLTVVAATGFPASLPFTLILERDTANEEVVTVTAVSSLTLTVTRAQDGTTGVSHTTGAVVEHGVSARDYNEPQVHIAATGAVHGLTGLIVGTTDVQTLSGKTLTAPVIATISNGGTLTLPTSTDTLVGRATTDTLTNKTLNGSILDAASTIGGVSGTSLSVAWSAWTPSATNVTTSSTTGHFKQIGKTVWATGRIVLSGAATSVIEVSLPANAALPFGANDFACGTAFFSQSGAKAHGTVFLVSDGTNRVYFNVKLDVGFSDVGPTTPWTWASGDAIAFTITYEAA